MIMQFPLWRALRIILLGLCVAAPTLALTNGSVQAATVEQRLRRTLEPVGLRILRQIKATPSQRRQLQRLGEQALSRLRADRRDIAAFLGQVDGVFAAEQVDGAEVEKMRVQVVDGLGHGTGWLSAWVTEVANTLTAKQRRQLLRSIGQNLM